MSKTRQKQMLLFAIAFIMAAGTLFSTSLMKDGKSFAATKKYKYTAQEVNDNGGTKFQVPALGLTGVCCQYNVVMGKSGKAKLKKLSNSSTYAKVAYYYGIKKGWDKKKLGSTERKKLTIMMQYTHDKNSGPTASSSTTR